VIAKHSQGRNAHFARRTIRSARILQAQVGGIGIFPKIDIGGEKVWSVADKTKLRTPTSATYT